MLDGNSIHSGCRAGRRIFSTLGALLVGCCVGTASAATVTLLASDGGNTSSFLTGTNWSNGQIPSVANDYLIPKSAANPTADFILRTPTDDLPYTFAGKSLTVEGYFAFKQTNVITVDDLRLTNGLIGNYFAGSATSTGRLAGNLNVITNGVIDAGGGSLNLQILSVIQGSGGLEIRRPGRVILSAANPYAGPVTIAGSTLELDETATLTPSSLTLKPYLAGTNSIPAVTNIVRAGGSLNVGNGPAGVLRVGYRDAAGTNGIAMLDVSAQLQFLANVGEFSVGVNLYNDALTTLGNVRLATNNVVAATNVVIADSNFTPGGTSTVLLGGGSNYFNTPTLTVGARKENGRLTLPVGGIFRLDHGGQRTDLNVSVQNINTSSSPASSADLNGTFIASLEALTIGQKGGGNSGGSSGSLTLSSSAANDVNVNTVTIGSLAGATSGSPVAQGTLTIGGGSFKVNGDVTLAVFDQGIGSSSGTLNLNGGVLAVAGDIAAGGGTSGLNVNAGVVNLQPPGDATPGRVVVDTLALDGVISNAASVTVSNLSGNGTLVSAATTVLDSFAPGGDNVGIMTVEGALTLAGTTTVDWQKAGAVVTSDLVQGMASVAYGGTLVLTNRDGASLAAGDALKIFDAGSYRGLFTGIVPNSPGPNLLWDTSVLTQNGTLKVAAVPALSGAMTFSGTNLNLSLTGATNQLYTVLTSTNVALPLSQWLPLTNGVFTTNPLVFKTSRDTPERFFVNASPGYTVLEQPVMVAAATKPTNATWNVHATRTLDNLPTPLQLKADSGFSQYGGLLSRQTNATGYFYPLKINGRWWLVDPEGCLFLHRGVAAIATINTTGAVAALTAKFGTTGNWATNTTALLRQHAFNGAGAWSDTTRLRAVSPPLVYTIINNFMGTYASTNSGPGYPYVFDPAFATFCDNRAKTFAGTKTDPWLLGYFSDNELAFPSTLLTTFLGLTPGNSSYEAAWAWLRGRYGPGATTGNVTTQDKYDFLGYVWGEYYRVVSQAIKKYDPNHLYLGSRFYGSDKDRPEIFHAVGPYVDVLSVNYYSRWTPDISKLQMWEQESGRPVIITEFYVKGEDSGMPNTTGAGWVVHTQHDRGLFYENFTLALLESKVCVGWHWFKYTDNDPDDPGADPSNLDSNKGVVSNRYVPYDELLNAAKRINERVYRLTDYFDGTFTQ